MSFSNEDLQLDSKELKITEPTVASALCPRGQNLLIISDKNLVDNKLSIFENIIEYEDETFSNRSITDVFQKAKFVWINLKNSHARVWISKNLAQCPYKIILAYSSITEAWIQEIYDFLTVKPVKISLKKLKKINALNSDDLVEDIMKKVLQITKPNSPLIRALSSVCGSKKKK